ncbi:MAG TPA: serine hydrolase [Cyclobacteriaceae bacterium]|nr:serine hydrolase [Cyclobacteriaceae bacterium]
MQRSLTALLFLIATTSFAQPPGKTSTVAFDQYVDNARKQWNVPGMSIVVVKNGTVVFKKGYGVTEIGKSPAVDTKTLFACASTTKAMTATVLGMLVDEGKINWDDRVTKYLPGFQLKEVWVTRELRVRDLLLHNTGLPSTNFLTGIMNVPPDEMFRRMALVDPIYSFRAGFEYQNTFYTIAGKVIEVVTGKRWHEVMTERLFTPLGMTSTVPKRSLTTSTNITKPHFPINDSIKVLSYGRDSDIGAAGGVWSNVDDMAIWMNCMLDSGKYSGGRLVSSKTWTEMFKPQNFFPENEYPALSLVKPNWRTYGFGWYQIDYKGRKLNFHTGSLEGLTAIVGLLPEEKTGVFIFGNYDHAEVRHALMYKALDWFALNGTRDWNVDVKKLFDGIKADDKKNEEAFMKSQVKGTRPSLALKEYSGIYQSALYGTALVTVKGDKLQIDLNNHVVEITCSHWNYDTFIGGLGQYQQYKVLASFVLDSSGKPGTLILGGDYEFRR